MTKPSSPQLWKQLRALKWEDFQDLPKVTMPVRGKRVAVSLLIPAREATPELDLALKKSHEFLSTRFKGDFEIILIPNPAPNTPDTELKKSLELANTVASQYSQVRVVPHVSPPGIPGKGAALRTGFLASCGDVICFTDSDLPYDLHFFDQAFRRLEQGYDLVTANRRRPESRFDVPIALLPIAYGRHRLGLLFNRMVRLFFPVQTTDTQAGIKAFSRRLAEKAFSLQRCPGFFFDLELILVNHAQGWAQAEIPVSLELNSEKSTVRILREAVLAVFWLTRIWGGYRGGHYGKAPASPRVLTRYSSVRSASQGTRFFLLLRWLLTPYWQMAKHLPRSGAIFDYGCGHGMFGLALAQQSPDRKIIGIDHDLARIAIAKQASRDLTNVEFSSDRYFLGKEAATLQDYRAKGIALIDVMHYFEPSTQEANLRYAYDQLDQNGVLIFREVDPHGGAASSWNKLYEKIATSIGFTKSAEERLYFRSKEEWLDLLREIGFKARAERCSSILFADVLFIAEKFAEKYDEKVSKP
jgi:glycosyltransferase involved in cell wall biosynthesis